ncbi:MATE family efflux transporter [Peptoniphilaceae bacterium SGI.131]
MKKALFWKDRGFLQQMFAVAFPIAFQFLISTSINMADTVMISSLGAGEIAAVGLVNQFVFFFIIAVYGICSAGAVFFAQYFGDQNTKEVKRYLSITLQLVFIMSLIFTGIALMFPYQIMGILIPDSEVINLGVGYLKLIALTFIISAFSQAFNTVLRSCNRGKESLLISLLSFFTNVIFNYIFIFGKFGAPALGVAGAALGTIIARFLEFVLLSIKVFKKDSPKEDIRPVSLGRIQFNLLGKFFKIAVPIIAAEVFWSLGQLLFSIAYARIGKDATAAIQLTNTIQNVFFIAGNSISAAAAVLIGQSLGAQDRDYAQKEATYFLQLVLILSFISSLILIALSDLLMKIYGDIEPSIYSAAKNLLVIRGIFISFRFFNGMIFVGIFRAGGETKLPFIFESITMWLFAIPMSFIGVIIFRWSIELVFTIVSLEELFKFILIYPLYLKKRWLKTITH